MKIYSNYWLAGVAVAAALSACTTHRSMGVKGAVEAKLASDPVVSSQRIDVSDSGNGVVTLKGNLDSQEAKDRAISLAQNTEGVTKVNDLIAVRTGEHSANAPSDKRSPAMRTDDHAISVAVKNKLRDDPVVKARDIDVDTRQGVVFLTGTVATEEEKDLAIRIARDTEGVKDVEANLHVGA